MSAGSEITDQESLRNDMIAQAGMYGLLARLWLREIDQETLSELQTQRLQESLTDVGLEIPGSKDCGNGDTDLIDELAADFCRIFIGPRGHISPHQSVWKEGAFQGDLLESLNAYTEIVGRPSGEFDQLQMNDHTANELAMMQRICESAESCTSEELIELQSLAVRFFNDHVAWIVHYCSTAKSLAQTEFYRSLLQVTGDFLSLRQVNRDLHG